MHTLLTNPQNKYQPTNKWIQELKWENENVSQEIWQFLNCTLYDCGFKEKDRKWQSDVKFLQEKDEIDKLSQALLSQICDVKCETLDVEKRKRRIVDDNDRDRSCRINQLYEHCRNRQESIEEAIKQDLENNTLFRQAWNLHPDESSVFTHITQNIDYEEPFSNFWRFQGRLTNSGMRAALVYSQTWQQGMTVNTDTNRFEGGFTALSHIDNEGFYPVFNTLTRNTINNPSQYPVNNYPYAGFYMALFNLPRYTFQYPRYDTNQNFLGFETERVTFPTSHISYTFLKKLCLNPVLVRGSSTNYFIGIDIGSIGRFGTFTSFTDTFEVALRFVSPPEWDTSDFNPTIIIIEETPITNKSHNQTAYARPIRKLSLFPDEREYLIDPITRFEVRDLNSLSVPDINGNMIRLSVVILRYLDQKMEN